MCRVRGRNRGWDMVISRIRGKYSCSVRCGGWAGVGVDCGLDVAEGVRTGLWVGLVVWKG